MYNFTNLTELVKRAEIATIILLLVDILIVYILFKSGRNRY